MCANCGSVLNRLATRQMPPKISRQQYSDDLRLRVIVKWKAGLSQRKIGRHLLIPRLSVQSIVSQYKKHGYVKIPPRSGRPRLTTPCHDRRILRAVEDDRFISAAALAAQVSKEVGVPVSRHLIRDRIHDAGFHGRPARKAFSQHQAPPTTLLIC